MSVPRRIQRKRTKGWRKPENTVDVTRGSSWGNPFYVGDPDPKRGFDRACGTAEEAVKRYADYMIPYTGHSKDLQSYLISEAHITEIVGQLRGKNLMCWCKEGEPCHGDWLLEIANDPQYFEMAQKIESMREVKYTCI